MTNPSKMFEVRVRNAAGYKLIYTIEAETADKALDSFKKRIGWTPRESRKSGLSIIAVVPVSSNGA